MRRRRVGADVVAWQQKSAEQRGDTQLLRMFGPTQAETIADSPNACSSALFCLANNGPRRQARHHQAAARAALHARQLVPRGARRRQKELEAKTEAMALDETKKAAVRQEAAKLESEHLRERRSKMSVDSFEQLDIIGRGAFGEVGSCA